MHSRVIARRVGTYKPENREDYESHIREWIKAMNTKGMGCPLRDYTDKNVHRTTLCVWCDEVVNMACKVDCVETFDRSKCLVAGPCQCKLPATQAMIDQHVERMVTKEFGFEDKGKPDPLKNRVTGIKRGASRLEGKVLA